MKGKRNLNAALNKVLGAELVAINQYFLHARIFKNWGMRALGKWTYQASIATMKEADVLVERILFLEGLPNLQDLGKLHIGQTVPEILQADLAQETVLHGLLLETISQCESEADFVSRDTLGKILEESEERIDYWETQLELLGKMGTENYLQSAVGELD